MARDPIVDEIRTIRERLAKAYGYNVREIARALQATASDFLAPRLQRSALDVRRARDSSPEIARTAPYMHDGSFITLGEVLEFYNRGGNANPFRDRELRPLGLSEEEKQALLAFLRSLTGDIYEGPRAGVADPK